MKSLLRGLPTTDARVMEGGLQAVDLSMTAEVIAVLEAILLEKALGDEKIPLEKKVEWVLRSPPFLTRLTEGFARKKGAKMPKTTEALKEEFSKRSESVARLVSALGTSAAAEVAEKELADVIPEEGGVA
jgi:hypothetical protein